MGRGIVGDQTSGPVVLLPHVSGDPLSHGPGDKAVKPWRAFGQAGSHPGPSLSQGTPFSCTRSSFNVLNTACGRPFSHYLEGELVIYTNSHRRTRCCNPCLFKSGWKYMSIEPGVQSVRPCWRAGGRAIPSLFVSAFFPMKRVGIQSSGHEDEPGRTGGWTSGWTIHLTLSTLA